MSEENAPQKERFLREVEQQLLRKELDAKLLEDGLIHIRWKEKPLCSVDRDGIVRFRPADITGPEVDRQLRTVIQAAGQVKEYANSISGTKDISQLTERLDDYVILPGCGSAQSIGKYLVGCGAFLVPEKLIGYINYEAVGTEFQDAHGGAACSRGFVVRKEGLPQELLDELHDQKQTQEMAL